MRWRIASAYIVLIVSTLALLALYSRQLLRTTYLRTLEAGLAGQARLVATHHRRIRRPPRHLPRLPQW